MQRIIVSAVGLLLLGMVAAQLLNGSKSQAKEPAIDQCLVAQRLAEVKEDELAEELEGMQQQAAKVLAGSSFKCLDDSTCAEAARRFEEGQAGLVPVDHAAMQIGDLNKMVKVVGPPPQWARILTLRRRLATLTGDADYTWDASP